jgi:hypothetical protein
MFGFSRMVMQLSVPVFAMDVEKMRAGKKGVMGCLY